MSNNTSYALLNNSTDNLDVVLPVKESASPPTTGSNASGDILQKRYMQIAVAIGLYWYERT
jgi:hypothetical protein